MGCGASKPDVKVHFGHDGIAKSNGKRGPEPDDAFNYSAAAQSLKHTVSYAAHPQYMKPFQRLTSLPSAA